MKKIAYLLPLVVILMATALPYVASAAIHSNVWSPSILGGPLISCTGAGTGGGTDTKNCEDLCDLVSTAANVIYFGIGVVIWIIAPIMIAWSGISLILSQGNPQGISAARDRATRVVIGLLIVLCAYLIISVFVNVLKVTDIGGFGGPACSVERPQSSQGDNSTTGAGSTDLLRACETNCKSPLSCHLHADNGVWNCE
ncbi:MAG: hypothetical protein ABSC29_00590 [Minisyncoccia bacterium]|jgi:hypothetical protein